MGMLFCYIPLHKRNRIELLSLVRVRTVKATLLLVEMLLVQGSLVRELVLVLVLVQLVQMLVLE